MSYEYMVSIDIGKVNFAFCVERFDKTLLDKEIQIPLKERYKEDGTPTEKMKSVLERVYRNGEIVLHDNVNITQNCDKKKTLDPETFHNMTDLLDTYGDIWDKCSVIVIEKQMSFRGKINTMALKLGQHCYSYFTFRYGRFKPVYEYEAYHKTHILGAPKVLGKKCKNGNYKYKSMEQRDRKKWSVIKGIDVLKSRNDKDGLERINKSKKKDDLCDCLLQGISFVVYEKNFLKRKKEL